MTLSLRRLTRVLRRDTRGAAAVEFAMVVPLLLALIFSTLEAGWIMLQSIMLDRALDMTVRELRVGSFENPTQEAMRLRVCERAMILADCNRALALELIPIQNAASYPTDAVRCVNRSNPIAPVLRFSAGARADIMFVRACFVVSPITPGLGLAMALTKDESGAVRLVSKSAFANEPA
ncbi:TadE-like protein [Devosia crocina]|uniref:TadE-like protein n=1 Tax=Devosia crocina TaxID=429728 RepID=A0A1I7MW11_9HYPH|nr:TadE/TadG family type IV pilus assembly protein [Devosia crocina]SFV26558.1 TadE-like protein [Devosia crocina]